MEFLAYYVKVLNVFPFTKYRIPESNECIFHWPERKLPNVPIICNVVMKFLIYFESVVNIYLCWLMLTCICLIVVGLSGENVTWQRKKTWRHSDTRPCDIKSLHVTSQRNNTMRIRWRAYRNTIMLIRSHIIRDIITESQYCITWH